MSPPAPPPAPLAGLRVLDLSRLLPGPYCSQILLQLGAEVLKVEDPGAGDYLRGLPPRNRGENGAFYALNRGKRSLCLDLKQDAGRELLLRLLPRYRVMLESFRPGVLDRLGLDYATLRAHHPALILCSISGYGQSGPLAGRAGHDIDYLALSGVLAAGGVPDGDPALPGVQIADLAGGALWAAVRILAALQREEGCHLDVSMTEGALALLLPWLGQLQLGGPALRRGRDTLSGGSPAYRPYRTADGRYLAVGALEPKFWRELAEALGLPASGAPTETVAHAVAQKTRHQWEQALAGRDACTEPMLELEELADHPQHRARGVFYTLDDPRHGPLQQLRLPLDGPPPAAPAPAQGAHSAEVLAEELGLSEDAIADLRRRGVIR